MQNYPPSAAHQMMQSTSQSNPETRDKLSSHVKKRILSNSSPIPGDHPHGSEVASSSSHSNKTQKSSKRSKKDPNAGDSEPNSKEEEKTKSNDKNSHKPDILTSILNEKKASLMRDPAVIAFLKKFNQELQRVNVVTRSHK